MTNPVERVVGGVDGCRGGWFYFAFGESSVSYGVVAEARTLVERFDACSCLFTDMPMGLADDASLTRACESEARKILGPRRSSVFSVPLRPALATDDYAQACHVSRSLNGKAISRQTFGIAPRIRELDELLRSSAKARTMLRESHPEVCFWALAGGHPMCFPKKTREGFAERLAVLEQRYPGATDLMGRAYLLHTGDGVARDDVLDAMANALNARAEPSDWRTLPRHPIRDGFGIPMSITYADFGNAC